MSRRKSFSNDSEDISMSDSYEMTQDTDEVRPERSWWWKIRSALGFLPIRKNDAQELLIAIRANDENEVARLLEGGFSPAEYPEIPWLCVAARRQNRRILEMLLLYRAEVNTTDNKSISVSRYSSGQIDKISNTIKSRTALHEASKRGWSKGVKILLEAGAEVNKKDAKGESALEMAVRRRHTETVRILLEGGAVIVDENGKLIPYLHIAPNPEIVWLLLSVGAKIDAPDKQGLSPLHIQVWNGRLDVVQELLKKGANPNVFGPYQRTPAFFLGTGDVKLMLHELMGKGLELALRDTKGNNACHAIAFLTPEDEEIEEIFDLEPSLWTVENHKGETPLDILDKSGKSALSQRLKSKIKAQN